MAYDASNPFTRYRLQSRLHAQPSSSSAGPSSSSGISPKYGSPGRVAPPAPRGASINHHQHQHQPQSSFPDGPTPSASHPTFSSSSHATHFRHSSVIRAPSQQHQPQPAQPRPLYYPPPPPTTAVLHANVLGFNPTIPSVRPSFGGFGSPQAHFTSPQQQQQPVRSQAVAQPISPAGARRVLFTNGHYVQAGPPPTQQPQMMMGGQMPPQPRLSYLGRPSGVIPSQPLHPFLGSPAAAATPARARPSAVFASPSAGAQYQQPSVVRQSSAFPRPSQGPQPQSSYYPPRASFQQPVSQPVASAPRQLFRSSESSPVFRSPRLRPKPVPVAAPAPSIRPPFFRPTTMYSHTFANHDFPSPSPSPPAFQPMIVRSPSPPLFQSNPPLASHSHVRPVPIRPSMAPTGYTEQQKAALAALSVSRPAPGTQAFPQYIPRYRVSTGSASASASRTSSFFAVGTKDGGPSASALYPQPNAGSPPKALPTLKVTPPTPLQGSTPSVFRNPFTTVFDSNSNVQPREGGTQPGGHHRPSSKVSEGKRAVSPGPNDVTFLDHSVRSSPIPERAVQMRLLDHERIESVNPSPSPPEAKAKEKQDSSSRVSDDWNVSVSSASTQTPPHSPPTPDVGIITNLPDTELSPVGVREPLNSPPPLPPPSPPVATDTRPVENAPVIEEPTFLSVDAPAADTSQPNLSSLASSALSSEDENGPPIQPNTLPIWQQDILVHGPPSARTVFKRDQPPAKHPQAKAWGEKLKLFPSFAHFLLRSQNEAKQMLWNGIPPFLRGVIWQELTGSANLRKTLRPKYPHYLRQTLPRKIYDRIDQIVRQHYGNVDDSEQIHARALHNVLRGLASFAAEIGYSPGLDAIVATLLKHMNEEEAFCMMVQLYRRFNMRLTFMPRFPQVVRQMLQLDFLLKAKLPRLHRHFGSLGLDPELFASDWFVSLFATLTPTPQELTLRVWDVFFHEGWPVVFKVILVLLQGTESSLLEIHDKQQLLQALRGIHQNKPVNEIMVRCQKHTFLTQQQLEKWSNTKLK